MNELSKRLYQAMRQPSVRHDRHSLTLHPSAASVVVKRHGQAQVIGGCNRQEYYRLKGYPQFGESNLDWNIFARMGKKAEDLIEELLLENGFQAGLQTLAREHPLFERNLGLSGRSDLILWDYVSQRPVGVDVKSVGEWKAGQVMEKPWEEHVLQCAVYLDYYQNQIPKNQAQMEFWYIWYVARSESWNLKKKKHGSPFQGLWDYRIGLTNAGEAVVYGCAAPEVWSHITIDEVYRRFGELQVFVENNQVPPRDYLLNYSEEHLAWMHKYDLLVLKKHKDEVKKWKAKGAPQGQLGLDLGDFECRNCPYVQECWQQDSFLQTKPETYNLPAAEPDAPPQQDAGLAL